MIWRRRISTRGPSTACAARPPAQPRCRPTCRRAGARAGDRLLGAPSRLVAILEHDQGILTPETQADVRSTVSNLNSSVKHIDNTVGRLNTEFLTEEARQDLHGALSNLNSALARADRILSQAERGEGAFHALTKDPKVANDIRVFIQSLREKGVLFYREVDPDEEKRKSVPERRTQDHRTKRR